MSMSTLLKEYCIQISHLYRQAVCARIDYPQNTLLTVDPSTCRICKNPYYTLGYIIKGISCVHFRFLGSVVQVGHRLSIDHFFCPQILLCPHISHTSMPILLKEYIVKMLRFYKQQFGLGVDYPQNTCLQIPSGVAFGKSLLSGYLHHQRNILVKFKASRTDSLGWAMMNQSLIQSDQIFYLDSIKK